MGYLGSKPKVSQFLYWKLEILKNLYGVVENNKVKCLIICEEDEFELTEYFEVKNYINNNILKIKLIGINNIINMEEMFYKCYSLKSLSDISKWKTNNVNNMSGMFYGCKSLI